MKHKFLLSFLSALLITGYSAPVSYANDFNCTLSNFEVDAPTPKWSFSMQKDLKILASWSILDPNKCIQQLDTVGDRVSSYSNLNLNNFVYQYIYPRKELRSYKHGRSRYITREHLQEFYLRRSTGEYIDLTYANGPIRS